MADQPTLDNVAKMLGETMVTDPPTPLGWSIVRDRADKPVYMVAIVFGAENVEKLAPVLERLRPKMAQPAIFEQME